MCITTAICKLQTNRLVFFHLHGKEWRREQKMAFLSVSVLSPFWFTTTTRYTIYYSTTRQSCANETEFHFLDGYAITTALTLLFSSIFSTFFILQFSISLVLLLALLLLLHPHHHRYYCFVINGNGIIPIECLRLHIILYRWTTRWRAFFV